MITGMRRIGRWTLNTLAGVSLLLAAAVLVLWAQSGWFHDQVSIVQTKDRTLAIQSYGGRVTVWYAGPPGAAGARPVYERSTRTPPGGGSRFVHGSGGRRQPFTTWFWFPHWALLPPLMVLPIYGVWLRSRVRRRAAAGLCPLCGYDLRATPDRCPECGHVPLAKNG
jgi:hypothetical protein